MIGYEVNQDSTFAEIIQQLKENNLPHEDLTLAGNLFVLYKDEQGNTIGAGGLEFYDGNALMRSVSVKKEFQGQKFGQQIVSDLFDRARENSIKKIILLTETAPKFFERLGFKAISRADVPESVKLSSEFTSVCPVSAVCMEKEL